LTLNQRINAHCKLYHLPEYTYRGKNQRDIPYSTSIYKQNLIKEINDYAQKKSIKMKYLLPLTWAITKEEVADVATPYCAKEAG